MEFYFSPGFFKGILMKVVITVTVDEEVREAVKRLAVAGNRNFSNQVETMLMAVIRDKDTKGG